MKKKILLETCYRKNPDIVYRQIGNEQLLVPIRRTAGEIDAIFALNEVAGRVWELIDGHQTVAQTIAIIIDEYDVDVKVAEADICELFEEFTSANAISEV